MAAPVSDYRSNRNEHITHAVNVLRPSKRRRSVFFAIYRGKKAFKTVAEIQEATGLSQVAVLQQGGTLFNEQLVERKKIGGKTAYGKVGVYTTNKSRIQRALNNPAGFEKKHPTKQKPRVSVAVHTIKLPAGRSVRATNVSCDDIREFKKVSKVKSGPKVRLSEQAIKRGVARILKASGKFTDWGGEKNDLLSNAHLKGKRRKIAFAFKGPGKQGILTPGKMGKNGDQIQRLFESPAEILFVQYHGQIADSVLQQMQTHAEIKSFRENRRIWYGTIDGDDTARLIASYPKEFSSS
jgi:hypothetical protein